MKKNIIEIPVEKFEVYHEDCCDKLDYEEAGVYCKELTGEGWRLPTRIELLEMIKHKKKLRLKKYVYWSNTNFESNTPYFFTFTNKKSFYYNEFSTYFVRAVRTIK